MSTLTWDALLREYRDMGWQVITNEQWVEVKPEQGPDELAVFRRDEPGVQQAAQFLACIREGKPDPVDLVFARLQTLCELESEARHVNGIGPVSIARRRRKAIRSLWHRLQDEMQHVQQRMAALPLLPVEEEVAWAQAVQALPNLVFLEVDTTGLDDEDEITRLTLLDGAGKLLLDVLIRPTTRPLSPSASFASGITSEQLAQGLALEEAWDRFQEHLHGCYVLSFNQRWDMEQLERAATRHGLSTVQVIGDCLQQHATRYYHGEYYLKLEEVCARAGAPLPEKPQQTSIDRAQGQRAVLHAMAHAITDLRPAVLTGETTAALALRTEAESDEWDPFLDTDELP